jgi:hypothetical protein
MKHSRAWAQQKCKSWIEFFKNRNGVADHVDALPLDSDPFFFMNFLQNGYGYSCNHVTF